MTNVTTTLQQGLAAYQAAKYAAAEALFRSVIAIDPRQPDAWHLLGLVMHQTGRQKEAAEHIRQALRLKPDFADAHYNLGKLLHDAGQHREAIECYECCLRIKPDYPEAHYNLGNAWNDLKQPESAAACFREAVRLRPTYLKALNNLGKTLGDLEQFQEAAKILQEVVKLSPSYAPGHCNLGTALRHLGRLDEAVAACQTANELEPGSCLASLGAALLEQDRFAEAEVVFRESIRLNPNSDEAYRNLAVVFLRQGNVPEAMKWNERAFDVMPDSPETRLLRAMMWLRQGDFQRGWPEYEWRWRCQEFSTKAPQRPPWDGSPIAGQTMLLHAEQGFGDTLQFIRFAPLVKERARIVMLRCSPRIIPLLSRCRGIDQFVPDSATLPVFDAEVPLMSLPRALKTTIDTLPRDVPYLFADPALIERWRTKLPSTGFRIGIAWQGNPKYKHDKTRSVPLQHFEPLASIPGVRLISLQKENGLDQIANLRHRFPIEQLGNDFDESAGAFMDTAAVMMNLDLVISSDTAIAHLAGGLGVPTWLILSFMPEWRWLLNRPDSPWYPTMRLFRQSKLGDWSTAFDQIRRALRQRLNLDP